MMARRSTITVIYLTISMLLASCSMAAYKCHDPLGCMEIPPGSPVVVGAILATNGTLSPIGTASLQSIKEVITTKGEILGHSIELVHYGTDCTIISAQIAATNLATDPDLLAVVGPTCAEEALVALPILTDAGIVSLSPAPDSLAADKMMSLIIAAIEQVAIQEQDHTLYIPRQTLRDALIISP